MLTVTPSLKHLAEARVRGLSQIAAALKEMLPRLSGWWQVSLNDGGGQSGQLMDSIVVKLTLEPQNKWPRGIFHNASYGVFHITEKGRRWEEGTGPYVAELASSFLPVRFIKKTGSVEQVIAHFERFLSRLSASPQTESTRLPGSISFDRDMIELPGYPERFFRAVGSAEVTLQQERPRDPLEPPQDWVDVHQIDADYLELSGVDYQDEDEVVDADIRAMLDDWVTEYVTDQALSDPFDPFEFEP